MKIVPFLRQFYNFFVHIIFLSIVAILVSAGVFHEPHIETSILVIVIALIIILSVLLILGWIKREYDEIYNDEKHARSAILKELNKRKRYENLRVCGTSCTSIFSLFDEYSNAIGNGKRIYVFLLNPDDKRIIDHLSDCEHDKLALIDTIRSEFSKLEEQLSQESAQKISSLIRSDDCYGRNLITASILLWKEAHKLAKQKNKGLTNGLELYLYSHLPNLKAWIFGESCIFIGSYNPLPGGVGINNPIKKFKGKRKNAEQIIQDCKRVTNFLIGHPETVRIKNKV